MQMGCWEQPLSIDQRVRFMQVFTSVKLDSIVRSVNGTSLCHSSSLGSGFHASLYLLSPFSRALE
ncbi:MAG: hypothetical protein H8E21_14545 [Gammaproteobacteria bacterium]|nr:hypothetical protein [Gammaproteobacteria bacterium]